jgi:hypothetical protein
MVKLRRMRWAGEDEGVQSLWENLKERDNWEDIGAGGRLILMLILEK